jgi:rhodanese-related sulfurtransferase
VLNSRERPTLSDALAREVNPVTLDQLLALQDVGAQVLDTRDPSEFAAAHLARSVNVGLGGQYATWAGTVLDPERPVVLVTDPGREVESATRLGRIGFDNIVGYLKEGLAAAADRPEMMRSTERLSPASAAEQMASKIPLVVDVRNPGERAQKAIPGSVSIPLGRLSASLGELPADRPLLVYCAGGYRSAIAASVLERAGFAQVREIAGGIAAWEHAGLALSVPPAAG